MITKQQIEDLANERIQDRNPALYIVEITINNNGSQILVEIDHETEGVSIEDCMSVSRNIEHNLDREVQDFSLEVASAGLSKPFRVLKQYIKNIGKQVKVKTLENGKIEGVLEAATENEIIVTTKEKVRVEGRKKKEWIETKHNIKMDTIKETNLIITFK
ncbi:MAG: ribosome assembly cofactor RimP [Crocinitomicaceae bacterium]